MASTAKLFGRRLFGNQFLSNSIVGGLIYAAGEATAENYKNFSNPDFSERFDTSRIAEIGMLGSLENGLFMTAWYGLLGKLNLGVGTGATLAKCIADQTVFATQSNLVFLGLCAFQDKSMLPEAVEEVKRTFLTTWIADCGVWPLVNFFGFAFVPSKMQPIYMVTVQFLWQVYASTMGGSNDSLEDEDAIEEIFKSLDDDGSGSIEAAELEKEMKRRGMKYTSTDLKKIMASVDVDGDGQISLEEFKGAIKSGVMKDTMLWNLLSEDVEKGARAAKKRLQNLQNVGEKKIEEIFRALDDDASGSIDASELELELKRRGTKFDPEDLKKIMAAVDVNGDGKISLEEFKGAIKSGIISQTALWNVVSTAERDLKDQKDREDALRSAAMGGSALGVLAIIRRVIFKI